jgi:hypothetical protein
MKFLILLLAIVAMVAFAAAPAAAECYPTTIYECPTYAAPVCQYVLYSHCQPAPCIPLAVAPNPQPYSSLPTRTLTPKSYEALPARRMVPVLPAPPALDRVPKPNVPVPSRKFTPERKDVSPVPTDTLAINNFNQPYYASGSAAPYRMINPNSP